MRKTMRRLLIDMDGTVARFYEQAKCIEKMYEPGFFSGLYPYENMIEAVKLLLKRDDLELYFLSSVDGESARADKKNWINMQLGIDVPCMFCNTDRSKADFVLETLGPITKTDYLLDDYSRNLLEWEEAGGTALKFINELNGRGWNGSNFNGNRIYYDESPEKIAHDLLFWMGMVPNGSPDSPVSQKSFIRAVDEIMTGKLGWYKDMLGWQNEIFACYDDLLSDRTLKEIFSSDDPNMKFFDLMDEWYGQEEADTLEILLKELRKELAGLGGEYRVDDSGEFINEDVKDMFHMLQESSMFTVNIPYDHFLKQKVKVDIMMDTGDARGLFIENSVYPHWGRTPRKINHKASIVWLSRTQGYRKKRLEKSLFSYKDALDKHGFLPTLGQELVNMPSSVSVLTFLVEMTLEQALQIAEALTCLKKWNMYSNSTLLISKDTMCGLYDPWEGGGSLFEIELKKDLYIPLKFIWAAKPDGCVGRHSISNCYGMCGSAWKDTLLKLNVREDVA